MTYRAGTRGPHSALARATPIDRKVDSTGEPGPGISLEHDVFWCRIPTRLCALKVTCPAGHDPACKRKICVAFDTVNSCVQFFPFLGMLHTGRAAHKVKLLRCPERGQCQISSGANSRPRTRFNKVAIGGSASRRRRREPGLTTSDERSIFRSWALPNNCVWAVFGFVR